MTSAQIYLVICEMLREYLSNRTIWTWGETAISMYVYAACGYYPQEPDVAIQCVS